MDEFISHRRHRYCHNTVQGHDSDVVAVGPQVLTFPTASSLPNPLNRRGALINP